MSKVLEYVIGASVGTIGVLGGASLGINVVAKTFPDSKLGKRFNSWKENRALSDDQKELRDQVASPPKQDELIEIDADDDLLDGNQCLRVIHT